MRTMCFYRQAFFAAMLVGQACGLTPNLDRLAADGIRYKQFYHAARRCPTRASLISGLYPHQAGMGWMAAADLGTPAYQGNLNDRAVTLAEVLRTAGYRTYMTGKWHLTNERKIDGMVIDNWPLQRGFDRYFGNVPGGANYFTPVVYSGNTRYKAPRDFYLTDAISDTSVPRHPKGNRLIRTRAGYTTWKMTRLGCGICRPASRNG